MWNSTGMLRSDLSRFATGSQWVAFLQLDAIERSVNPDDSVTPTPAEQPPSPQDAGKRMKEILAKFDRVASDEQYEMISKLVSFQILHTALREYQKPAPQRMRQALGLAARDLAGDVSKLPEGKKWSDDLRLDSLQKLAAASGAPEPLLNAQEIVVIQQRFNEVTEAPEYQAMTRLLSFQRTRMLLNEFVSSASEADQQPRALPPPPKS
ncbi:hypothetical protein GC176_23920 [bacterium]|nr:hypothetical protein [bacterium]